MTYDFTTRPDRRGTGSSKWDDMFQKAADRGVRVPEGVVPLSVADMEFVEAPEIVEAIRDYAAHAVLGYTAPTDEYVDAVIGWQRRRHDWEPRSEWLVLSPGVVPAFYNAVKVLAKPGEGIIIQPPVYYPFAMSIEANGRRVVENPLVLDEDGHYGVDFADLERKAADPSTKALLLCSPHNPVGRVWTPDELRRMVDICMDNDVFVISDEIHDDLVMPGYHHTTIHNVMTPEERDRCIVCTAPSKTFNLAGIQCSNIYVSDERVRSDFVKEFQHSAIRGLNTFAYPAAIAAYTCCEAWLDQLIGVIQTNHEHVVEAMRDIDGAVAFDLEGTYLQWLDLRCLDLSADELERLMTQDAGLYLDEGHLFGPQGDGFERMNLAAPTAVIDEALARLVHAARTCKG
jgi:cystathionine beta-lyase